MGVAKPLVQFARQHQLAPTPNQGIQVLVPLAAAVDDDTSAEQLYIPSAFLVKFRSLFFNNSPNAQGILSAKLQRRTLYFQPLSKSTVQLPHILPTLP